MTLIEFYLQLIERWVWFFAPYNYLISLSDNQSSQKIINIVALSRKLHLPHLTLPGFFSNCHFAGQWIFNNITFHYCSRFPFHFMSGETFEKSFDVGLMLICCLVHFSSVYWKKNISPAVLDRKFTNLCIFAIFVARKKTVTLIMKFICC